MAEGDVDGTGSDIVDMFDNDADVGLVCRVCGSLVAAVGEYPKAHWDWHEASNGV